MNFDHYVQRMLNRSSNMHDITDAIHIHQYIGLIFKSLTSKYDIILWQTGDQARMHVDKSINELTAAKRYYEKSYNVP